MLHQTGGSPPAAFDGLTLCARLLHAIWSLPESDDGFVTRWRLIKSGFSRTLPAGEGIPESKGERGIWQRRYWEHTLRDERGSAG